MKNNLLFIFFFITSITGVAQSEQDLTSVFGRICQTDSIQSTLAVIDKDSNVTFHFKTPDINKYGIMEYEFDQFKLIFDTGSNLLFAGKIYGSIDEMNFSKKKAEVVVRIEGSGDRKKEGKFETVTYSFVQKNYKWLLKSVRYH